MPVGLRHRRGGAHAMLLAPVEAFRGARALAASALAVLLGLAAPARATLVFEKDDFSLDVGIRLQPRVELERAATPDWQRDFLIRRSRLKLGGKLHTATYRFEWRLDGTDRIGTTSTSIFAGVENAYMQYPLRGSALQIRAGLYDQPFSRDRLTSDSRQLAVDRGLASNVLVLRGLADNAVGFDLRGRTANGHADWAVGLFDNNVLPPGEQQDWPMVVGRLDLNFGSNKDVFQDAHFGSDRWYSVGVNGSWQGDLEDASGAGDGYNTAVGVDGMVDVPFGPGRLLGRTEFNNMSARVPAGGNTNDTLAWMVGAGYLMWNERLQPFVRYDQQVLDDVDGGFTRDVTYVGANWYQKFHNLKLQADARFEGGTGEDLDGARLQAQIDF